MRASCLEELMIYQRAQKVADAVSGIIARTAVQRDRRMTEQLGGSSAAVPALMAEGFGLGTDRQFAQQLYRSRAESKETRSHLLVARGRRYITPEECSSL